MPIFISYSHSDREFVETLATNLVRAKHHVWIDRWELNVGDSLTAKIEEALTESSAILVVLSKNSVESQWFKRELTAGLVRELEEQQTLVLPCIIEDCEIPLFLRDKLYADFRKKPDEAFNLVDRSLSRISNATTSRSESPDFHTDWGLEWKKRDHEQSEETWIVRWTFVDHGSKIQYVVLSELKVYVIEGLEIYEGAVASGEAIRFIHRLLREVVKAMGEEPLGGLIEDNFTRYVGWKVDVSESESYLVLCTYRRLGVDPGMDTYVHLDNNVRMALAHMDKTVQY